MPLSNSKLTPRKKVAEREALSIRYLVNDVGEGWTTMSAAWEKNGHPVGVFVKYSQQVSHKYAYSVLQAGVWEALQNPDLFDITRAKYNTEDGNPEPYAVLTMEADDVNSTRTATAGSTPTYDGS